MIDQQSPSVVLDKHNETKQYQYTYGNRRFGFGKNVRLLTQTNCRQYFVHKVVPEIAKGGEENISDNQQHQTRRKGFKKGHPLLSVHWFTLGAQADILFTW